MAEPYSVMPGEVAAQMVSETHPGSGTQDSRGTFYFLHTVQITVVKNTHKSDATRVRGASRLLSTEYNYCTSVVYVSLSLTYERLR